MKTPSSIILTAILALTAVTGCSTDTPFGPDIYKDGKDSAFARLDRLPFDSLAGPKEQAIYAIEHCRLRGEEIHGSGKQEKVSALLSLGKYKQKHKDVRAAAGCFAEAARLGRRFPSELKADITLAQAQFYDGLVTYDLAEPKYRETIRLSLDVSDTATAISCGAAIARMRIELGDTTSAAAILDSISAAASRTTLKVRSEYEFARIALCQATGRTDEVSDRLEKYLESFPEDSTDWLQVCGTSLSLGKYALADTALANFRSREPEYESYPEYFLYLSGIYESKGRHKDAYDPFFKYLAMADGIHFRSFWSDSKFIEEEYSRSLNIQKGRTIMLMLALGVILLLIAGAAIYLIFKKYRSEYARLSEDKTSLKTRLSDMKSEIQALSSVAGDFNQRDKSVWKLVQDRIKLLNKCISQSMTSSDSKGERISEELAKTSPSRQKFLAELQKTFSLTRPHFICTLKEQQLTDDQIQICCLYALGLRGKDIMNYISRSSHYNQASAIRSQLGLSVHDTTLGNYIQSLLEETENHKVEDQSL